MKLQSALLLAVATLLNHAAPAAAAVEARDLALEVAKVYPSPAAAPIEDAVVLIQHGRIAALGKRSEEFEYMGRAMAWRDVLASLTSNPSTCFKQPGKGRLEPGMAADLVVLDADPASDVRKFSKVAYTIRQERIIYSSHAKL